MIIPLSIPGHLQAVRVSECPSVRTHFFTEEKNWTPPEDVVINIAPDNCLKTKKSRSQPSGPKK